MKRSREAWAKFLASRFAGLFIDAAIVALAYFSAVLLRLDFRNPTSIGGWSSVALLYVNVCVVYLLALIFTGCYRIPWRRTTAADLPRVPEVAVTDVSFISLELILPPINNVLASGGRIVALIKPQFEVGKGRAPGGLVRDEKLRIEARDKIVKFATEELGLELLGLEESPIRGKEMGNVEYLSYWRKP